MKEIIKNGLKHSLSYTQYRELMSSLLEEGKSTGPNQSESKTEFSKLNDRRMHRLDKKLVLSEAAKECLMNLEDTFIFMVITEGWCGDSAQVLPMINKVAEGSENLDLRIVLRDENEAVMNQFLTNGSKSVPKLIILEKDTLNVIKTWGPRPKEAAKLVTDYKEKHGVVDAQVKKDLQIWYNKDKGLSTEKEIMSVMKQCNYANKI